MATIRKDTGTSATGEVGSETLQSQRRPVGTVLAVQWLRFHLPMQGGGGGSIPRQGAQIPHALWSKNQKIEQKYCNKLNKDFKNGPHLKKKIFKTKQGSKEGLNGKPIL